MKSLLNILLVVAALVLPFLLLQVATVAILFGGIFGILIAVLIVGLLTIPPLLLRKKNKLFILFPIVTILLIIFWFGSRALLFYNTPSY